MKVFDTQILDITELKKVSTSEPDRSVSCSEFFSSLCLRAMFIVLFLGNFLIIHKEGTSTVALPHAL